MSDFYSERRTIFADVGGLAGMGAGAMLAAMSVWKVLATGFRTGEMEKAFGMFIGVLLAAGVVGGLIGLGAGRWVGRRWERTHRGQRPLDAADHVPEGSTPREEAPVTVGTLAARPLSIEAQRAVALVHDAAAPDAVPWGVWDGPRLVGVVWTREQGSQGSVLSAVASAGYDASKLATAVSERLRLTAEP